MPSTTIELIMSLIVALIPAVASIIALFKIHELHILVNSRLTELLASTRAQGISEGTAIGQKMPRI